ncbi:DegT/DnrJ/EryC1/StrS family aminotransferase [Pseudomonas palleroniana]|uniref:DegT/DnrJ/EryC1/StrS family aminotransferase n=1 Tax=Pseudomonas palleroniana TaxID=191390 RepID=A0A1H5GAW2_9PSED|nr:DegT/DnrJ/EryC1/StrS family aminotransferase [Pseudomonas palleroniana]KAB0565151.1 DegT/DnrJ/EryC1/StrS family aminotransferase [Pseudomonas palleroniana]PTC31802.1 DegT/DnrJ/EryC1/StrS family aminotransferase [Pseudomonas palleroniana]SEE12857.1 dTDP-4-amino-4,6-dideoxygalactose transaminase [Pseudomonas palleroniana]
MSNVASPIPLVKVAMPPRDILLPALESVLYSGMISEGEHVYRFEDAFAEQFRLKNVLATSSGTAALHLALLLAGVGIGDEVITTSMTAEPTNTTILQVGAIPVFADVERCTGNLCPDAVAAAITEKTKAICVVHYAGYPARLKELREIADRHGLSLIEDCAHALGAEYNGQPVGTVGDYAIYSFQAIKHMTTVDGGLLTMKNPSQMGDARKLRWFGLAKGVPRTEVDITKVGYKYNMHNVAAVIGLKQLEVISPLLKRHYDNGRYFDSALQGVAGLAPAPVEPGVMPAYWLYTLLADDSDEIEKVLAANGIMASKLHRPNHLHSVFKPFAGEMPGLEEFYKRLIHIPCGWWVSEDDRERIVDILKRG